MAVTPEDQLMNRKSPFRESTPIITSPKLDVEACNDPVNTSFQQEHYYKCSTSNTQKNHKSKACKRKERTIKEL